MRGEKIKIGIPEKQKTSERGELFENEIPREWLSCKDAAEYLRVSENALRICVNRRQIQAYKFGRRLRFRIEDLRQIHFSLCKI